MKKMVVNTMVQNGKKLKQIQANNSHHQVDMKYC